MYLGGLPEFAPLDGWRARVDEKLFPYNELALASICLPVLNYRGGVFEKVFCITGVLDPLVNPYFIPASMLESWK